MDKDDLQRHLHPIGQEHLLAHWDQLPADRQQHLANQIIHLDRDLFLTQQKLLKSPPPCPYPHLSPFTDFSLAGNHEDRLHGQRLLSQGVMGCMIMAGGQGTRLRFDGPKGMFPVTPIAHKTLFQLFAEKTKAASKQVGRSLKLAVMTSPLNHTVTVNFFQKHHLFGLESSQLDFFCQEMLPFLDSSGNLFLEAPDTIAMGPDGNGRALEQFFKKGLWEKWHREGVRYLNFIPIDNALADPFDAELLGYHARMQSDLIVKCTWKRSPQEKVGVLAKNDQQTVVVEYTEMDDSQKNAFTEQGELLYRCANLSLFLFTMDFIKQAATFSMPLHRSFKAAKSLGNSSMAWKFEKFIFDCLPHANQVQALLYPREQCFAPLKNFEGEDSLLTVQKALMAYDKKALEQVTSRKVQGEVEVSQEFHYPPAELHKKWINREISGGYIDA